MTAEAREQIVARYVAEPTLRNRNAVVTTHRYLCRRGARKFYRGTVDRADLEQVAAIGLIKASQRYSSSYDTPFEAYAWLVIVGELMHFVRDHERLVRIPRTLRGLDRHYTLAHEALCARLEREPTVVELSAELGVSCAVIDELRALRGRSVRRERKLEGHPATALDENVGQESSELGGVEERLALAWALRTLSERELRIIRGIFVHERSQAEMGRELGLSQRQVSRVLSGALDRLARLIVS